MGSQKTIPVSAFYMFLYNWTLFKLENIKGGSDTGKITSHVHTPHFFGNIERGGKIKNLQGFHQL